MFCTVLLNVYQDVLRHDFPEVLEVRVREEPFSKFLRQQRLCEGEDQRHGPRQVHQVDLSVSQGQGSFAAAEGLGDL